MSATTSVSAYVAGCATGPEIVALIRTYIEAGGLSCNRAADDLDGLLTNLEQVFEDGASSTWLEDMRDELTLCPDSNPHFAGECDRFECPTWCDERDAG
jgi:hypothetical protein